MKEDLPAPLTPADCDLRDFPFMPLDIVRLFGSRFHAIANDSEWRAGVTLWAKSFHQVPAGSVPDDEIELCRLAELGRDTKVWRKLAKNALHGWVRCSDGRLYHPTVCEKVNEAWERKQQQRQRSKRANEARWGSSKDASDHPKGIPQGSRKDASSIPQGVQQGVHKPSPNDPKGQGQGQGERKQEYQQPGFVAERDASTRPITPKEPRVGDPPEAWVHLADRLPDGSPDLQTADYPAEMQVRAEKLGIKLDPIPADEIGRPKVNGNFIDWAAEAVCDAAKIHAVSFRGDWKPLIEWLRDGLKLNDIVATIEKIASRPGYEPPRTLKYFNDAVRQGRAAA